MNQKEIKWNNHTILTAVEKIVRESLLYEKEIFRLEQRLILLKLRIESNKAYVDSLDLEPGQYEQIVEKVKIMSEVRK